MACETTYMMEGSYGSMTMEEGSTSVESSVHALPELVLLYRISAPAYTIAGLFGFRARAEMYPPSGPLVVHESESVGVAAEAESVAGPTSNRVATNTVKGTRERGRGPGRAMRNLLGARAGSGPSLWAMVG